MSSNLNNKFRIRVLPSLPASDGLTPQLRRGSSDIETKYTNEDDSAWVSLIPIADITGADGADGSNAEFRSNGSFIQYRLVGDSVWNDVVSLSELQGTAGANGQDGNPQLYETRALLKAESVTAVQAAWLSEEGREGLFEWKTGDYSALVTADTLEGIYIPSDNVAASQGCWVRKDSKDIQITWFGAVVGSGSDQSAILQVALNIINARGADLGGVVSVNFGVKIDFRNIVGVKRFNVLIRKDDILNPTNFTTYGTNEICMIIANANDAGIVNENVVAKGTFNPSATIELDNELDFHDSFLGTGQVRIPIKGNSAKASLTFRNSGWNWHSIIAQRFGSPSQYNGTQQHSWTASVILSGLNSASFTNALVASVIPKATQSVLRGVTSGAIMHLSSIVESPASFKGAWVYGRFQVGEALQLVTDIGLVTETIVETSSATITGIAFERVSMPTIFYGGINGAIGYNGGADLATQAVHNFNGSIYVMPSVGYGQFEPMADTRFAKLFLGSDKNAETASQQANYIGWDKDESSATQRARLYNASDSVVVGDIAPVHAQASLSDNGTAIGFTNSSNILSVGRSATAGEYTVLFATPMKRTTYNAFVKADSYTHEAVVKPASQTLNGFTFALMAKTSPTTPVFSSFVGSIQVTGGK